MPLSMRLATTILLLTTLTTRVASMARPATRVSKRLAAAVSEAAAAAPPSKKQAIDETATTANLLFTLDDPQSVLATLLKRPSARNKSPYVADVTIPSQNNRQALVHVPSLDLGGKCKPGTVLLCKPARDKKGNLVGPNALSPKYNTPKCEYIAQFVYNDESKLISPEYPSTWVGAHPSLGERIAHELISRGSLFRNIVEIKREVSRVEGLDMRADFVLKEESGMRHVLEIKTVVDSDYSTHYGLPNRTKCVFTTDKLPYKRTALFPWGQGKQKGPNGEPVVSARAIKHVRELTKLASMDGYKATALFIVIRDDAESFRPNNEACPSFCKYLKEASDAGVNVMAKRVSWNVKGNVAECLEDKTLDIEWPVLED